MVVDVVVEVTVVDDVRVVDVRVVVVDVRVVDDVLVVVTMVDVRVVDDVRVVVVDVRVVDDVRVVEVSVGSLSPSCFFFRFSSSAMSTFLGLFFALSVPCRHLLSFLFFPSFYIHSYSTCFFLVHF